MARSIADEKKKEDPLVIGGIFIGLVLAIILVMWFFRGAAVTKATLNPLLSMSKVWLWVGMDFQYQSAFNSAVTLSQELIGKSRPSIVEWINLVNVAFMPWFLLLAIPLLYITVQISRKKDIFMRRFTAKKLMLVNAEHFTGTLPVIAIRNDIVTDRNPLWRRQVTPEEVFLNYKSPTTRKPLTQEAQANGGGQAEFNNDVAEEYFSQIVRDENKNIVASRMLGRLLVNIVDDSRNTDKICFPDRMSNEGKTVFALFSAVAFGGEEGAKDFEKYRDLLNRSAFGSKNGQANLSVANDLYQKMRENPMAKRLFAVHHWEYSYLFALLELAQRQGRYTTAEILWLRPANRVMFFALNTRGSSTPHTEAATTFTQYDYERRLARLGRYPLNDKNEPIIFTKNVVRALRKEWDHWNECVDDSDEEAWRKLNPSEMFSDASAIFAREFWEKQQEQKSKFYEFTAAEQYALYALSEGPSAPPPELLVETPFDKQMQAQEQEAKAIREKQEAQAMAAAKASINTDASS